MAPEPAEQGTLTHSWREGLGRCRISMLRGCGALACGREWESAEWLCGSRRVFVCLFGLVFLFFSEDRIIGLITFLVIVTKFLI